MHINCVWEMCLYSLWSVCTFGKKSRKGYLYIDLKVYSDQFYFLALFNFDNKHCVCVTKSWQQATDDEKLIRCACV